MSKDSTNAKKLGRNEGVRPMTEGVMEPQELRQWPGSSLSSVCDLISQVLWPLWSKLAPSGKVGKEHWVSEGSPDWAHRGGTVGDPKFKMPSSLPWMPFALSSRSQLIIYVTSLAVFLSSQTGASPLLNIFPHALYFPFEECNPPFINYPTTLFPSVYNLRAGDVSVLFAFSKAQRNAQQTQFIVNLWMTLYYAFWKGVYACIWIIGELETSASALHSEILN